jgi:hypothetical protein
MNRASTSTYEVNPARNNGKNFAYEETVRGNARKKLDAGACDCCKDVRPFISLWYYY